MKESLSMDRAMFDDIVTDEDWIWTQVCEECAKTYSKLGRLEDIPVDGLICGVTGCDKEAQYYLTIYEIENHDEK